MKTKVYLSGAIKDVLQQFQNWRDKCSIYKKYGLYPHIEFLDPNEYFNYTDKLPKTDKQCIDLFMWMVEEAHVLLVNLDHSNTSKGTCMEVEHAYCAYKPIIGFGCFRDTWYPWAEERCSVVFETLEDAIHYINNTFCKILNAN